MNTSNYFKHIVVILFVLISNFCFAQYQSSILHYNNDNRLVYHSDKDGNRIPGEKPVLKIGVRPDTTKKK